MTAHWGRSTALSGPTCASVVSLLLSSCVSWISSYPDDRKHEGFPYALPAPILQATPKSDGTVAVEFQFPADEQRAYVLSSSSFFANSTVEVEFDHGLLKRLSLEADSSAVAAAAVESAGNVTKARIDAETTSSTTQAEAKKAGADQALDALITLKKAQAKLNKMKRLGVDRDTIIEAELAVAEAKAAYKIKSVRSSSSDAPSVSSGDAWGPVFFRIVQEIDPADSLPTVRLVAADVGDGVGQKQVGQKQYATADLSQRKFLTFVAEPSSEIRPGPQGQLQFKLVAENGTYKSVNRNSGKLQKVDGTFGPELPQKPIPSEQIDKKSIIVDLPDVENGNYFLSFKYTIDGSPGELDGHFDIKVVR